MARPRSRRIASEDSDNGSSKDVAKKTKEKGVLSTRKKKPSTFVVSIPKTRVKLPAMEADPPRKLIVHSNSSASSSPLPSSTVSYANRPSFPSGHLSFKNKNYQVSCPSHDSTKPTIKLVMTQSLVKLTLKLYSNHMHICSNISRWTACIEDWDMFALLSSSVLWRQLSSITKYLACDVAAVVWINVLFPVVVWC